MLFPELQLICWQCIDEQVQSEKTMDYLQVFKLNPDTNRQSIEVILRQEEPFAIKYLEVKMTEPTNQLSILKIWVIGYIRRCCCQKSISGKKFIRKERIQPNLRNMSSD